MSTFGESYSNYYNLLYKDKNYCEEVRIVDQYIQRYTPEARTIMDLGCGTGKHAGLLTERGYKVLGVDRSETMLSIAKRSEIPGRLRFLPGDLRSLDIPERFDAVISLFHVICYLNKNEDLQQAFQNISKHLHKGGVFIFDCWYGPAVLAQSPSVRIKELVDSKVTVTRITHPTLYENENIVDVHFQVFIKDKHDGTLEEIKESHRIRYLFTPEIEGMLKNAGIKLVECFEFLTGASPGLKTWSVCFVGRKL